MNKFLTVILVLTLMVSVTGTASAAPDEARSKWICAVATWGRWVLIGFSGPEGRTAMTNIGLKENFEGRLRWVAVTATIAGRPTLFNAWVGVKTSPVFLIGAYTSTTCSVTYP